MTDAAATPVELTVGDYVAAAVLAIVPAAPVAAGGAFVFGGVFPWLLPSPTVGLPPRGVTFLAVAAVAWPLSWRWILSLSRESERSARSDGSGVDPDVAAAELEDLAGDLPDLEGLPVARRVLDRAERYRDHDRPDRARIVASLAVRIGRRESTARSVLVDPGTGNGRGAGDDDAGLERIEALLDEAVVAARTDPERAEATVEEAARLATRISDGIGGSGPDGIDGSGPDGIDGSGPDGIDGSGTGGDERSRAGGDESSGSRDPGRSGGTATGAVETEETG